VGTIVGSAFFVLILISGFFFYTLMNQGTYIQQQVFSEMRNFDIERAQENLKCSINPVPDSLNLTITLKNTGPRPLNITTVGIWNNATFDYYNEITINGVDPLRWIKAGEQLTFNVTAPLGTYQMQFLTEKGLLFTVSYP